MTTIFNNSTSAFYERSLQDMGGLRKQAETLQMQISKGQRLSRSSDDPVAASKLRVLARAESLSQIDSVNTDRASTDLTLTDTALSSFADYITRIRELTLQAANGTLSDDERKGIGVEIGEIRGNLVALANTRDSSGHALFGGESSGEAYSLDASGNATYIGTATAGEVPLGDGQKVSRGLTGPDILNFDVNGTPNNLLTVVKNLADALQGGVPDPGQAATDALDSLTKGLNAITTGQTIVGARLSWIDLTTDRRINLGELRTNQQNEVGGTDTATAISQMQEVMLALQATQASFTKLAGLSLFNAIG